MRRIWISLIFIFTLLYGVETEVTVNNNISATNITSQIIMAQQKLKDLGYYNRKVDGIMGLGTKQAIMNFQRDIGIKINGKLDSETLKRLQWRWLIKLNTHDFAPFHYIVNRQIGGAIYNVVREVCIDAQINCVIDMPNNWGDAQKEVKDAIKDGLFVIGWNTKRESYLYKSDPLIKTAYGVFVKRSDNLTFNRNIKSLKNYKIGVYGPSNTSRTLKEIRRKLKEDNITIEIKVFSDNKKLFKELNSGNTINAVYSNKHVGLFYKRLYGLNNIRYAGDHKNLVYYMGFSKLTVPKELIKSFNDSLKRLKDSGKFNQLLLLGGIDISRIEEGRVINKADNTSSRFVKNGDIIQDKTTCLEWQLGGSADEISYQRALTKIKDMNSNRYNNYSDWRIPTIEELKTLKTDKKQGGGLYLDEIFDSLQERCWSSTKKDNSDERLYIDFYEGEISSKSEEDTNYLKAVRGGLCQ